MLVLLTLILMSAIALLRDFFSDIRYYRLRKPRPLKKLMIINKGGCGRTSPGIGDVQFVKNVLTDTIVTTNFRCSKFGMAHNSKAQFGWVCALVIEEVIHLLNHVFPLCNIYSNMIVIFY